VRFLSWTNLLGWLSKLGLEDFLELGTSYNNFIHYFCTHVTFICKTLIDFIVETTLTNRINWKEISDIYYYEPGGTSTKNIMHWIQFYSSQKLAQYDYGKKLNLQYYGTEEPPLYNTENFKKWKIKTYLTSSDSDPFSNDKDTEIFLSNFSEKSLNDYITVEKLHNYNHLDYLWSEDAKTDIYDHVLNFLK
jgi:hypothetical protein